MKHAEALTQAIVGQFLAQVVLWMFGLSLDKALLIGVTMFAVSYARAYVVRAVFNRWLR